jgi:hypothetical protein
MSGEKDLLDLLAEDDDDTEDDPMADLQSQLEELKRENQGLLHAKQEEKRKRQANQSKLESVEEKLNKLAALIDTRSTTGEMVDDITKSGITVDFTEDGTAFIPKDKLNEVFIPSQQKIQDLEKALQATKIEQDARDEANKVINEVLGEDERYPAVYANYQKARNWAEQQVIEFQKENNLHGKMNSGQALDYVFDEDLESEFNKKFPGMDLETVVTAEDSVRLLRRMFRTHVTDDAPRSNDNERFKKVLKKPAGLGQHGSSKTEISTLDKLDSLTQDDIDALSDKQVEQLMATLREEELRG